MTVSELLFALQRQLDEAAGFVMGGPAEAEGLQEGGVTGEAGADAGWLMGVGTEADDLASHLTVSQKNIMVKLDKASPVTFVAFGVDFQGFAFVDQEAEHLVEDVAEVAVEYC